MGRWLSDDENFFHLQNISHFSMIFTIKFDKTSFEIRFISKSVKVCSLVATCQLPITPHCWRHLVLVRSLPTSHIFHQSLEEMHWFKAIFKMLGRAVFEDIEVEGGCMVKEQDFEAEKNECKKVKHPTLLLCLMDIFLLEIGQNQQSPLKSLKKSLVDFIWFWAAIVDFLPMSSWKMVIGHKSKVKEGFCI